MTWLFVPGISSPSAQASEDLNSASCSPSTIGERLAEASATWRGKEQPPQAWSRRWKQGGFIRLLSGLTCSPSTLDHGVAQFISSLREIPARTTASPESAPGPMASDSLPPKSPALPKSAGLILSSERTSRGTRTDSLKPSPRHWKGWAIALRQEYSARPKPVIPCDASDCSSWPSASVTSNRGGSQAPEKRRAGGHAVNLEDVAEHWTPPQWPSPMAGATGTDSYNAAGNSDFSRKMMALIDAAEWMAPVADDTGTRTKKYGQGGTALSMQATNWSSPKASDPEKAGPNMRGSKGDVPLPGQAMQWIAPMASDDGQKVTSVAHQKMLCNQAASFRPPSSLDQPIAGGSMSSTDSPNSNQPSVKRKLNPIFVEALMRWPTGLSGFERQEMAWTRWWLLMPSFLSQLCSQPEGERQMDLFGEAA